MKRELARKRIRIISENELNGLAGDFLTNLQGEGITLLSTSQIQGLENIARTTEDINTIMRFVKKQQEKERDYSPFYGALINKMNEVKALVKKHNLLPQDLTNREERSIKKEYELLLIREFIYHLVSHNLYIA